MFPYDLVFTAGILGLFLVVSLAGYVAGKIVDSFRGTAEVASIPAADFAPATKKAA